MLSYRLAILPALALFLAAGGSALADEAKMNGLDLQNEATGGSVSGNRTGAPTAEDGGDDTALGGGMHKGLNVQYGNKGSFGLGGGSSETAETAETAKDDDGSQPK